MPGYVIREVDRHEYADRIRALDTHLFDPDEPLRIAINRWWAVELGGQFVGYAGMRPVTSWDGTVFLSRSGVREAHRGHGLQARLIRARLAAARRDGFVRAITYTIDNVPSANSLIRCGFRLYEPASKWGGETAIHWKRPL